MWTRELGELLTDLFGEEILPLSFPEVNQEGVFKVQCGCQSWTSCLQNLFGEEILSLSLLHVYREGVHKVQHGRES